MRVAVIIGWGASKLRVVRSYVPLYREKGYETVCVHMPTRIGWWPPLQRSKSSNILSKLHDFSQRSSSADGRAEPADVVLHLFSGSSFIFLPSLFASLEQPNPPWRLRAIVHDSGPVTFTREVCENGVLLALNNTKSSASRATAALLRLLLPPYFIAMDFVVGDKHRSTVKRVMASPHSAVPQLFLYSRADSVIDWREVEERMSEQKKRGVPVMSRRWDDSEHVRHYVDHPEEYKRTVSEFLDRHVR